MLPLKPTNPNTSPSSNRPPSHQVNNYLSPIVAAVEEGWESPAADQFGHAYRLYLEEMLSPIEELEDDAADIEVQLRANVQRMIEIAPDLFDKATRRTPYESGYFIEEDLHHV